MYISRLKSLSKFQPISHHNHSLQTTIISSKPYSHCNDQAHPLNLNHPILSKLETCSNMAHFNQIHAHLITTGLSHNVFVASRLLKFTSTSLNPPQISLSTLIFSEIQDPDVYSYNLIIRAFSHTCHSLSFYQTMLTQGLHPNEYTLCFLLTACARSIAPQEGRQIHSHLIKYGLDRRVFAATSLIHMYGCCSTIHEAFQVFVIMPQRTEATWGAMVDAFVSGGYLIEGLKLFVEMRRLGIEAGNATLVSALCACAELGDLSLGRMVHAHTEIGGLKLNATLGTSLVDMYAKCGDVDMAVAVFHVMPVKSVPTWNCMIHALAMNGRAGAAIDLFEEMQAEGVRLNAATFVAVMLACCHAGLVEVGNEYFSCMSRMYGVTPNVKHYGCLVDLFGRAGRLEEALEVIGTMPMEPDVVIWGTLFGACRIHGYTRLGELVWVQIMKLQPHHNGGYTFLSDMYAMAQRWDDVAGVRKMMMEMDIRKIPGCSFMSDKL